MEGRDSIFPLEIECKIIGFALVILPIDMDWNKRVMQEWSLTKRQIPGRKSIPVPMNLRLSYSQEHMLIACWCVVLKQEPSLLIESFTRAGKTTLLVHFTLLLWQNVTPNTRILYLSSTKRASGNAKSLFLETQHSISSSRTVVTLAHVPENVCFEVIGCKMPRGRAYNVIIYDCDQGMPAPFALECDTCICSYSRWIDPNGHVGLNKTWDTAPTGGSVFDSVRERYRCILTLPYKNPGKFSAQ